MELDKEQTDNIMPKTRQDKTRQDKTRQDKTLSLSEITENRIRDSAVACIAHADCHQQSEQGITKNRYRCVSKICCKLNKMPEGHLTSLDDATICDFYSPTASTVTSRYYKGLGAHKDNMVLEIWRK